MRRRVAALAAGVAVLAACTGSVVAASGPTTAVACSSDGVTLTCPLPPAVTVTATETSTETSTATATVTEPTTVTVPVTVPTTVTVATTVRTTVRTTAASATASSATPTSATASSTTPTTTTAPASGWPTYQTSNPDYPAKVDFVVKCAIARSLPDDPIVKPGQPGAAHLHDFSGNVATDAFSTEYTLSRSGTNCGMTHDRAAYWVPAMYSTANGVTTKVESYESRHYYRAGTSNGAAVQPMPFGLRIVAGDPMAMAPQKSSIAGWQCRDSSGNTVAKQATPPQCPAGDFLEGSVVFPNCWDGAHLDSADHRSHMSYAAPTATCDAAHPVRLPQLTSAERYLIPAGGYGAITLAPMPGMAPSGLTLHADFLNAWAPATMSFFVDQCIRRGIACEDVSDRRIPPGTTLPAAAWPTGP